MVCEDIYEPIEVISHFKDGKLKPLRFRWNDRVYKISQLNGHWVDNQGFSKEHHFSVIADTSDLFEILFNNTDFKWQITKVCLNG